MKGKGKWKGRREVKERDLSESKREGGREEMIGRVRERERRRGKRERRRGRETEGESGRSQVQTKDFSVSWTFMFMFKVFHYFKRYILHFICSYLVRFSFFWRGGMFARNLVPAFFVRKLPSAYFFPSLFFSLRFISFFSF